MIRTLLVLIVFLFPFMVGSRELNVSCADCALKTNASMGAPDKLPIVDLMAKTKGALQVAAALPPSGVTTKNAKIPFDDYVYMYCHKFFQAEETNLDMLFDDMEATPFPDVAKYLSTPGCQPKAYGNDVVIPAIQLIADDPITRKKFLEIIKTYFDFIEKPGLLKETLNAKSKPKNETFLDYMETIIQKGYFKSEKIVNAQAEIIAYACANGAEYNVYKNKKCPK